MALGDPFGAMELARELLFRRTIRNLFFPNVALDVQELKSLLKATASGMDELKDSDLEKLATENAEEYLDRLRERDPRFTYEVTFGGNRGPTVFPPAHEPYLVSSMTDGSKIIKAYARDHEALQQDPVGFNLQLTDSGSQKYLDFIRTGKEQTWEPQEVSAFNSTFPLLSDIKFTPGSLAVSVRSMPDDRVIPLKLLFSREGTLVVLDYVEFRKVRSGAEEVEIATVGTQPLGITLVLPFNPASEVTATFSTNLPGQAIQQVAKACDAFELLQSGCTLELVSLKLNGRLCTLACDPLPLRFKPRFLRFVKDLSAIAARFHANFAMPFTLTLPHDEEEDFMLLKAFALGNLCTGG